jgi:hypothetical protein
MLQAVPVHPAQQLSLWQLARSICRRIQHFHANIGLGFPSPPALLPGACLTLGPAQVLAGGDKLQLPATVNIGLNAQGLHIMDSMQYR